MLCSSVWQYFIQQIYIQQSGIGFVKFPKMQPYSKFEKRLLVIIGGKGMLILLKSRKLHLFVNFISRQKIPKLFQVWDVKIYLKELFHNIFLQIENRILPKSLLLAGKLTFLQQQELEKLLKGVKLKLTLKNLHSKSFLRCHLYDVNAKKHDC